MRIAHISDLHFGRHFIPTVAEQLSRRITDLAPDAIVVSGDLTQRARKHEFSDSLAYLKTLQANLNHVPLMVVPGNHDIPLYHLWNRLTQPYHHYHNHYGQQPDVIDQGDVLLVGLNSTSPYRALINGRVSSAELERCGRLFAASPPEQWRVLVLHHHLLPPPGYDRRKPMPKARRLLAWLHEMKVDVVLNGHLHRAYVGNTLDVYPGDHRAQGITVVQCGTSTSQRGRGYEREKNSFNLVEFQDEQLRVEHWIYMAEGDNPGSDGQQSQQAGFSNISTHTFTRSGR
ncbi:MAG: metallophosphoesterase [Pseudomonadales bacterium]